MRHPAKLKEPREKLVYNAAQATAAEMREAGGPVANIKPVNASKVRQRTIVVRLIDDAPRIAFIAGAQYNLYARATQAH